MDNHFWLFLNCFVLFDDDDDDGGNDGDDDDDDDYNCPVASIVIFDWVDYNNKPFKPRSYYLQILPNMILVLLNHFQ